MNKAWIVARHEFAVTVKRVWFIVATFVFPLLFTGLGGGMLWMMSSTLQETQQELKQKPLGLIDRSGRLALDSDKFQIRRFDDEAAGVKAVSAREVSSVLIVPKDWVEQGAVRILSGRRLTLTTSARPGLPDGVEDWMSSNLMSSMDPAVRQRALRPLAKPSVTHLDETGQPSAESGAEAVVRSGAAYVFFFLLFVSIFSTSQYLLQGMAEEKENKVMEMVLTSVTPVQLMTGKLLGLGAAGLLQLGTWMTLGVLGSFGVPAVIAVLEPGAFALCLVYFLLGYLLFGSLMLGFGSLGTTMRESQQMASLWSLIGMFPICFIFILFEKPQGTLARTLSLIPFTAPTSMVLRFTIDPKGTPWWEIAVSAALMIAATVLAVRVSARLFRAGLLLYGKRPGLREIWRWVVAGR
jgi:ABC-2 type transport system permease protein